MVKLTVSHNYRIRLPIFVLVENCEILKKVSHAVREMYTNFTQHSVKINIHQSDSTVGVC